MIIDATAQSTMQIRTICQTYRRFPFPFAGVGGGGGGEVRSCNQRGVPIKVTAAREKKKRKKEGASSINFAMTRDEIRMYGWMEKSSRD